MAQISCVINPITTRIAILAPIAKSGAAVSYRHLAAAFVAAGHQLAERRSVWRRALLSLAELAGVVLVAWGVAQWSWPSAIVLGGLAVVAALEVRPGSGAKTRLPPPPEDVLRRQAESAAMVINNERYGIAFVDPLKLAKLTVAECEQLIVIARSLAVKT
jgi:hypothetical protein